MKNIMSIDPSLRSTGIYISFFNNDGGGFFCTIKATRKNTEKEIYNCMRHELLNLIIKYKIGIIFFEDYPYHIKNSKSITKIAEVKGVIKSAIYSTGLSEKDIILVPIQTWKSYYKFIKGQKKDKSYIAMVNNYFCKNFDTADVCDAFLIYHSMQKLGVTPAKTETQFKLKEKLEEALND